MKKIICLWLFLFCSTFLCACELLPVSEKVQNRAKRNMYNHYLDDANYNWCIGVVKEKRGDLLSIQFGDAIDELNWSGLFWDYSSEGEDLSSYFEIGDVIEFCMAGPFDKNMQYPLVSIKKGDMILLEFEEGKSNLLYWVENFYQR